MKYFGILFASLLLGCSTLPDASDPIAQLQLVESVPQETEPGDPDLPKVEAVWMDMISKARRSLDISQFYVQTMPHSSLDRVLKSMEYAVQRGITIRFLLDETFVKKYPDENGPIMDAIKAWPKTEVRFTHRWSRLGGISHAKYFIVDDQDAFLGSPNFDWRALDHNKELGFRLRSPPLVSSLQALFQDDWAKAGNREAVQDLDPKLFPTAVWRDDAGQIHTVALKVSPNPDKNNPVLWDLPYLLQMIREAKSEVRLTSMIYRASYFDKTPWPELEQALIDAATRGVAVKLLVDNKNRPLAFKALVDGGVQVGLIRIPPHSSGLIPAARLVHANSMVVDDRKAWLGTGTLEADSFYHSRNISLILDSPGFVHSMAQVFERDWSSSGVTLVKASDN